MLGRLLSTFSPNAYASRNSAVLESVTEEEHTSGLLFPDPRQLHRSSNSAHAFQTSFNSPNASTTGGYDDRGGLELDVIKDFRIIIAQNAIGDRDEPCILLDSKGSPDPSSAQGLGLDPQVFDPPSGRHSRTSSLSQAPSRRGSLQTGQSSFADGGGLISQAASARKIPPPVSSGAFSRARCRNSISSVTSNSDSILEPYHNRTTPENGDTGLLNCIFGSSAFSYKGSSTKMHILSTDSDIKGTSPASREVDALGGRQTPRTSLARTYSSGTQSPRGYFLDRPQQQSSSKVTILVTRMFSVNLPESRDASADSPDIFGSLPPDAMQDGAFPFPDFAKRRKIKEKKTPMYAVAITIQVPLATRNNGRPISRTNTHGPDGPKQMSFSLDSDPHWSSAFIDDNHSQSSGLDDRIDLLVDHWDVITRTLTFLEKLARREILVLLKKVDAQVSYAPKPNVPKALKMPNMQRTNQTIIQLRPNVLAYNSKLKEELLLNAQRISAALRIPRVVLGQSRWGVWREEARWIARLMADKEHGLFFLVLITAFLGNHTEWLDSLGPDWYRRRHQLQQKLQQDLEPTIASRTVIVSDNKMVARRLIFILSAFLPAKHRFDYINSPMRPGTSTSTRPLSQSPPTFPLLRQESLRRRINRRARAQRLNTEEPEIPQRSGSVSSNETAHKNTDEVDQTYQADSPLFSSHRRDSDVRSITAASLPIVHATDARTRATTSTTTNNSAVPVPHFTSRRRHIQDDSERPGIDSNDSYASAKLLQNLRRSETNMSSDGNVPAGGTKWVGNILSGLWTGRPDSSRGSDGAASVRRASLAQTLASQSRPEDDNTEAIVDSSQLETSQKVPKPLSTSDTISIAQSSTTPKNTFNQDEPELAPTDQVKDSPLKLSVRGDDGVVDVDLPLRGFLSWSSSNDSTLTSPKKARTSVTSMDVGGSMQSSYSNNNWGLKDNESPTLNVGGWLKNFHEDFLLQAVRPYHGIEADIKRAMQAESSPHTSFDPDNASITDRWVEVASTLVADTRSCTVKRIRLLRKINANPMGSADVASPATVRQGSDAQSSASHYPGLFGGGRSRKGSIATLAESIDIDEAETKFVEEPVVDVDGTLVDAIERVLIQSGQSSLAHSRTPSPHRTVRVDERERPVEDPPHVVEVPRNECRKTVLGALEEVARTVAEDHCRDDNDTDYGIDPADKTAKRRTLRPDNTLREGVRKWLLDIEEAL